MIRAVSASTRAHDLVKRMESATGPRLQAYQDSGDPVTIGYGHTGHVRGKELTLGTRITHQEADALFIEDSQMAEDRIDRYFGGVPLTQGQRDALFSFCYNLTLKSLINSTLRKMILGQDWTKETIIEWWVKYRNPRTIFEEGLYRRRLVELCLWFDLEVDDAFDAELRRDRHNEIAYMSSPDLIIMKAENRSNKRVPSAPPTPKPTPQAPAKAPEKPKPAEEAADVPETTESAPEQPETREVAASVPMLPDDTHVPYDGIKSMVLSRRFWGWFLIIFGRVSIATDISGGIPVIGPTIQTLTGDAMMFEMTTGIMVMMSGEAMRYWGERKATKVLE